MRGIATQVWIALGLTRLVGGPTRYQGINLAFQPAAQRV